MKTFDHRLNDSWWALRIALGLMPIIAGVDKYFNKLADWGMYLSPYATKVVPVSTPTFTSASCPFWRVRRSKCRRHPSLQLTRGKQC